MKRSFKAGKNRNSGFSFNVLTDDECDDIHLATLEVLKKKWGCFAKMVKGSKFLTLRRVNIGIPPRPILRRPYG